MLAYIIIINLFVGGAVFLAVISLFRPPEVSGFEAAFRLDVDNIRRHSLFEVEWLRPLLVPVHEVIRRFHAPVFKKHLFKLLLALGNPNQYTAEEYMVVCFVWGVVSSVGLTIVARAATGELSILMATAFLVVGFLGGFFGTYMVLRERALRRLRAIARRLPYALDLIAMAMDAGATFYEAATSVVRDEPEDPLNQELGILVREIDFGRSRQDALTHLGQRITVDGLDGIISAVLQAESLGTPLAEVLKLQANLLRMRRSMRAERKAGEAAVKMLIPSMLILISVVLIIFSPFIVHAIHGDMLPQ
jgi:tight adherence protein C